MQIYIAGIFVEILCVVGPCTFCILYCTLHNAVECYRRKIALKQSTSRFPVLTIGHRCVANWTPPRNILWEGREKFSSPRRDSLCYICILTFLFDFLDFTFPFQLFLQGTGYVLNHSLYIYIFARLQFLLSPLLGLQHH